MKTSTRPSAAPVRRSAKPFADARRIAWLAALALAACAPAPSATAPTPRDDLLRAEPNVRVGLAVDTSTVEIRSDGGLRIVDPASRREVALVDPGAAATFTAGAAGRLVVRTNGRARETQATVLSVERRSRAPLIIAGDPYRGTAVVRATGPGRLTAINQVEMEEYLLGVVPREIGRVGEELLEAAKAQAVAARTYAVRYLGRREALGFDVFATVQDQVYGGMEAEHDPVSRAVRETSGEIITHRGSPIEAFYHSTCAGRTAAIEEVWPTERPRPYLVSVVDVDPRTGEAFDRSSNRFEWTERWTADELTGILNRTLADSLPPGVRDIGEIRDIRVLERTASGRIGRMVISTTSGDYHVGRDRIRWVFLRPSGPILNSSKFDVQLVRDAQGTVREIVATGGGWGHGIGMCQFGAMGRARAGQDYRTILRTYYAGAEITDLY